MKLLLTIFAATTAYFLTHSTVAAAVSGGLTFATLMRSDYGSSRHPGRLVTGPRA